MKKNFTYAQSWKNNKPDKLFSARPFSWAWFDTGYCNSIWFPQTFGKGDSIQLQDFHSDILSGNLATLHGEWPDLEVENIKLEYISFVFENEVQINENGILEPIHGDIRWTLDINDLVDFEKKR